MNQTRGERLTIEGEDHDPVSAIHLVAPAEVALLVMAHGAGAPMTHVFMESTAEALADRGISTLRYNFSYMEQGRRRPDHAKRLTRVVASALSAGRRLAGDLPLVAGGKSMGGRMTSTLLSESEGPPELRGIVFFGFPLHAPRKPDDKRAAHLGSVRYPTLFLQGTRDDLADLTLLRPHVHAMGDSATLHVVEGADHSFKVLKRSGRTAEEVGDELADVTAGWIQGLG
ncbi:MAG: alpha/beta hydrolase family protein [Longimicrobiales bacterium]